jgi:hypothetical protein
MDFNGWIFKGEVFYGVGGVSEMSMDSCALSCY